MDRKEAISLGLSKHFTGRPCCNGHRAERWTSSGQCVECYAPVYRKRAKTFRAANPDESKRRGAATYQAVMADPQRADRKRKSSRKAMAKRRLIHRDKLLEIRRLQYDPIKDRERRQKWQADNPLTLRASRVRIRSKRKKAEGTHNGADIAALLVTQENHCVFCRADLRAVKWHVDHKMPLARGGTNWPENLQILCAPCNLSKGKLTNEEFRVRLSASGGGLIAL